MNHDHSQTGGQTRHVLLMLLCCLIPVGLILAISVFGLSLGPLAAYLPFAMVLLCPLMMFFMMRGMGQEHDGTNAHSTQSSLPQARATDAGSVTARGSADVSDSPPRNAKRHSADRRNDEMDLLPVSTGANHKSCH